MADTENFIPVDEETKKNTPFGLIAISIILAGALIFLIFMYFDQKTKMGNKMAEMETVLTAEKDSLRNELKRMVVAYDTLKSNNDSINIVMQQEKKRIIQLLAINASNTQLIKKYKSEITTMRDIMKSYIVQIDSLNTRNKALSTENREIRQQITNVRNTNTELSKVKQELTTKVEIAS